MIELRGHILTELPINGLKKVADLLEYEGPILSHFIDEKKRSYMFYWTDYDENYNRWLVWKVSENQLYSYVKGVSSLKDILLAPNKDYVFSVDIDKELNYNNIRAIEVDDLAEAYIPEEESFFNIELSGEYNELVESYKPSMYLSGLREKAVYFTLEPRTDEHSRTVSALDAANFLKNITKSFLSFVEYDFVEKFKNTVSDLDKLIKTANKFKDILTPRVVDLGYSSFKVALSTDTYKSAESKDYTEWQRSVLGNYKDDVIEIDYNSEDKLTEIAAKYPEPVRKSIYSPLIDIINDKKYQVNIEDPKRKFKISYKEVKKKHTEILIPKPIISEKEEDKKKLVNLIVEIKDKEDIKKVGKRELQSGLLFSQEIEKTSIQLKEFRHKNNVLTLKLPIWCELHLEENNYFLNNSDFKIDAQGEHVNEVISSFNAKLIELYLNLLDDDTEQNKKMKQNLMSLVDVFKEEK